MAASPAFPAPQDSDTEDVAWALETAGALWARGDAREAIRWLRRAAETAGENGNDLRAVDLARTAADLATELQIPPSIPPPPVEEAGASTLPHPGPAHDAQPRRGTPETTAMSPAMAEGAMDPRAAPAVGVAVAPDDAPPPSTKASEPPPAWSDAEPTISEPGNDDEPTVLREMPEPAGPARSTGSRVRQAFRVSVVPSSEDKGLLLCRMLGEGDSPPAGAHEAILVALEAGAHMLAKRR